MRPGDRKLVVLTVESYDLVNKLSTGPEVSALLDQEYALTHYFVLADNPEHQAIALVFQYQPVASERAVEWWLHPRVVTTALLVGMVLGLAVVAAWLVSVRFTA